jgi:hypothetical protein
MRDAARRRGTGVLLWLWLAAAVAAVLHAIGTGSGLLSPVLGWQLRRYGAVYPMDTIWIAGLLLIVPPILLLARRRRGRKPPPFSPDRERRAASIAGLIGLALALIAGFGAYRGVSYPSERDALVTIALDTLPADARIGDSRAILAGTPQTAHRLSYDEVEIGLRYTTTSHTRHSIVPMTAAGWKRQQPVRFLIDLSGHDLDAAWPGTIPPTRRTSNRRRAICSPISCRPMCWPPCATRA